jgi:tetratricopeptide (TPR) repeat protein
MPVPMKYLGSKILVVDDEASMRKTISHMVQKIGFKNVITAENGKKALDLIKISNFALVIADINMPEMTGSELFSVIKKDKKYEKVSFIFITAETTKDVVAKVAEEGADDYLIKPFVLSTLDAKITRVLEKKYNPSEFEQYVLNFKQQLDNKALKEAEEYLSKAAQLFPESFVVAYNSGLLCLAKGDAQKAIEFFKDAIKKKPMFVKAYNALGKIYEDIGDTDSSLAYYEKANEISPASSDRLITLSRIYTTKGETGKAEEMLKNAISGTRADVATSTLLIGQMYLSKNEPEKALESLLKAYKINPSDLAVMQLLAEAYRRTGHQGKAIEMYEAVLKVTTNDSHVHYQKGKTYIEMGDKAKAIESITKAWELNPFSKDITNDLKALAETQKFSL